MPFPTTPYKTLTAIKNKISGLNHPLALFIMLPPEEWLLDEWRDNCWHWEGAVTRHGTPRMTFNTIPVESVPILLASNYMDIPPDAYFGRKPTCTDPLCINPHHHELGEKPDIPLTAMAQCLKNHLKLLYKFHDEFHTLASIRQYIPAPMRRSDLPAVIEDAFPLWSKLR